MSDTDKYKVPTNAVKIPDGDTGYNMVKKSYRRFIWTWNDAPLNVDGDYDQKYAKPDVLAEAEVIPGGLSSGKTVGDIAKLHDVSVERIESQLYKGIKVEMEHTSDPVLAEGIAKDHLVEDPNYYDKLEKIENDVEESSIGDGAWNNIKTDEISGMGNSDMMPSGVVGYKSGPLSKKTIMPSQWYADPDDVERERKNMKNLKYFRDYYDKK